MHTEGQAGEEPGRSADTIAKRLPPHYHRASELGISIPEHVQRYQQAGRPLPEWYEWIWMANWRRVLLRGPLVRIEETEDNLLFTILDGDGDTHMTIELTAPFWCFKPYCLKESELWQMENPLAQGSAGIDQ